MALNRKIYQQRFASDDDQIFDPHVPFSFIGKEINSRFKFVHRRRAAIA
jgi:hypothetical protein